VAGRVLSWQVVVRYSTVLRGADYQAVVDPADAQTLEVWRG
jgi:hypothetical protein